MSYFSEKYHAIRYPIDGPNSPGLRRAQLGAIHSIASHFTRETDSANIEPSISVLPTGSGKTAIIAMAPFVLQATRALIVTPSRLVRHQISEEISQLAILKRIGVLPKDSSNPGLKMQDSKISSLNEWEELREFDIVVSTPNCISPAYEGIPAPPKDLFDVIIIDEAHHEPAKTWRAILDSFEESRKLLFTATPFREDKKEIKGVVTYEFSIREAYKDGIFGPIQYVPVELEMGANPDLAIAQAAQQVLLEDRGNGLDHYIFARTKTKKHAKELEKIYRDTTSLNLRLLHSQHSNRYAKQTIHQLREKKLDGIIAIDMLGEGFDFPNLKIAAIHSAHKSLPVTLQFIGRFARTNVPSIGPAKFIAVPQQIEVDAKRLYQKGASWQEIIPDLYQTRIEKEIAVKRGLASFQIQKLAGEGAEAELKEISRYSLTPYHHVKIYRAVDGVNLAQTLQLPGLDILRRDLSEDLDAVFLLTREISLPKWAISDQFARIEYDLYVIYFDEESKLLFINTSRKTDSSYDHIVAQLAIGRYSPLPLYEINRVITKLQNPTFFSVGMRNRTINSQTETYRIIAGSQAHRSISSNDGRLYSQGHVFGRGEDTNADMITLGFSGSSKVWSNRYSTIPEFIEWCKELAGIINTDLVVKTGSELDSLPVGQGIASLPPDVIGADWEKEVYLNPPHISYWPENSALVRNLQLLDFDLLVEKDQATEDSYRVVITDDNVSWKADYSPRQYPYFTEVPGNPEITLSIGSQNISLIGFINQNPIQFFTSNFTLISGGEIYPAPEIQKPFEDNRVIPIDWAQHGVDIKREAPMPEPAEGISIHEYLHQWAESDGADVIFYDHGKGEISDLVSFKVVENNLLITLIHAKAMKARNRKPGSRVDEIDELAMQANRAVIRCSRDRLVERIRYRVDQGYSFLKGDLQVLEDLLDSDYSRIKYQVILAQPGLSKSKMTGNVSTALSATDEYIVQAGCERLMILCSS